jgi:hypothetical protein
LHLSDTIALSLSEDGAIALIGLAVFVIVVMMVKISRNL